MVYEVKNEELIKWVIKKEIMEYNYGFSGPTATVETMDFPINPSVLKLLFF